jgi:glucose-6-phosphate-specific signal transduction histidine kinase
VGEKLVNILIVFLQYALLPITYPIHLIQMRKLNKRIEVEYAERKRIQERNARLNR